MRGGGGRGGNATQVSLTSQKLISISSNAFCSHTPLLFQLMAEAVSWNLADRMKEPQVTSVPCYAHAHGRSPRSRAAGGAPSRFLVHRVFNMWAVTPRIDFAAH